VDWEREPEAVRTASILETASSSASPGTLPCCPLLAPNTCATRSCISSAASLLMLEETVDGLGPHPFL
jgi:hypothetical protein